MDLVEVFVREIITIGGYSLLVAGVYKLFQISGDLREIKQALKDRAPSAPPAISAAPASLVELHASDDASTYAEKLLRAVNAESHPSVPADPPAASEPR